MSPTLDPRCSSKAEVVTGYEKRCIRQAGHQESHVWLEAWDVVDGEPIVARWNDGHLEVRHARKAS